MFQAVEPAQAEESSSPCPPLDRSSLFSPCLLLPLVPQTNPTHALPPPLNLVQGGWTYSSNFANLVNPSHRATFASSAVQLLESFGLDGIDVDWEYPKDATEARAYTDLLRITREKLDEAERKVPGSILELTVRSSPFIPVLAPSSTKGQLGYRGRSSGSSWEQTSIRQIESGLLQGQPTLRSSPSSLRRAEPLFRRQLCLGPPLQLHLYE
jgi:hypothetical protein